MGMGMQFAVNNSVESKNKLLKEEIVFDSRQNQKPMDQLLEECSSRESIRTTMIKHESIFREQVAELHRLYGVQKKLMSHMKSGFFTNSSLNFMNHQDPTYNFHQMYQTSAGSSTGEVGFYPGDNLFKSKKVLRHLNFSSDKDFNRSMTSRQEYSQVPGRNLEDEITLERVDLSADTDGIDLDLSLSIGCKKNHQKSLRWVKKNCSLQRPSFHSQRLGAGIEDEYEN